MDAAQPANWWERRSTLVLLALLSAVPLLWPDIAPLVDLPGHMGRHRVALDIDSSPYLSAFYEFRWALVGNLGVDLLVMPLAPVLGLELAVKLIVTAIPPLTVAGFLWVAREVHGRIPPTALFAVPLAYNFPFMFGFVNFALSMALAFLAFALWLRLARLGRLRLRAALFVPLSLLIWVTHAFGWGTLGLLAFSAELIRQHDAGHRWLKAWVRAGIGVLPLTPPALLMLAWRSGHAGGFTGDWFNWRAKFLWLIMVFRDQWKLFDLTSLGVLLVVLVDGMRDRRLAFSRNLGISALFLFAVFVLLPRIIFGSAYADMRLLPYAFAVAVVAVRLRPDTSRGFARTAAAIGLAFALVRLGATTISFWRYDRAYDRELAALADVPRGARLVTFVGGKCREGWRMHRLEHLGSLATVRREAFSNDQWRLPGGQLLGVRHGLPDFAYDPSEIVTEEKCPREFWLPIRQALARLPRDQFDYVWLIQPPPYAPASVAGMRPIWRSGGSVLYRIEDRTGGVAARPE